MIPKRIFFCWFGHGEMSDLNKMCIKSWEKFCPDYEIVKIDESNFDYTKYPVSKAAYEHGNFSMVSDVARVEFLKKNSGFYLDTDVELLKSLDYFRNNEAVMAEAERGMYNVAFIGCSNGIPADLQNAYKKFKVGTMLHILLNKEVYASGIVDGSSIIRRNDCTYYGIDIFGCNTSKVTDKTVAIHHEENTWVDKWKGGFEVFSDIIPCEIYLANGIRDTALEQKMFGNRQRILALKMKEDIDVTMREIEYGNYFEGKFLQKISTSKLDIVRLKKEETDTYSITNERGEVFEFVRQ